MKSHEFKELRGTHRRIKPEVALPVDQIAALENFIEAAHEQLLANAVDRNEGDGWPKSFHWFDASLETKNKNAVIRITSYGPPEVNRANGLFVYITQTVGQPEVVFSVQTPTTVYSVDEEMARKLSHLWPKQYNMATQLIAEAEPIDKATYEAAIHRHPAAQAMTVQK